MNSLTIFSQGVFVIRYNHCMLNARIHVAVPTAFHHDESLNIESTLAHADWLISQGITSILFGGSTGEQHSMDASEKRALYDAVNQHPWAPGIEILVGVAAIRQCHAVELGRYVASLSRIDGILLGFPPYVRPTQEQARRYAVAVIDAVRKPTIIYNHPERTGFDASASTLAQLCMLAHVIGIKDPGGTLKIDEVAQELTPFKTRYYAGGEVNINSRVSTGFTYLSSIAGNMAPKETVEWFEALRKGLEPPHNDLLSELVSKIKGEAPIQTLKDYITDHEGIDMGVCRAPLGGVD